MRVVIVLALLVLASTAMGQMTTSDMPKIDCTKCHTCPDPTPEKLCLKPCPTLTAAHSKGTVHPLSEAPDSLLLDDIADLYGPVHFNHKVHARMAEMNSNCQTCHHYSPAGKISPCKECHGGETNPNNLRQPGLKGAYHRQCLSCHREWSHDTQCTVCHAAQAGKQMSGTITDSTDVMGKSHPLVTPPVTKVYQTPYAKGPVVTFFHKEHIELFGLKCVDCHKQENCSYCHDLKPAEKKARTQVEIHAVCSDCHKTDECSKCHDTKEKPAFTHAKTGWPLNRFHAELDCRACHPTGKKIARLNNQCANCHAGWNQSNFQHAVTGLILDETHREAECTDCHVDRKYSEPPTCSGCHDDNRSYKTTPPGTRVKK